MAIAQPELVSLRRCKMCGAVKPIEEFVRAGAGRRLHKCRSCLRAHRREQERRRAEAGEPPTFVIPRARKARRAAPSHRVLAS
jgi:ribosome-binding protein aMBF1 (putative translation factor)